MIDVDFVAFGDGRSSPAGLRGGRIALHSRMVSAEQSLADRLHGRAALELLGQRGVGWAGPQALLHSSHLYHEAMHGLGNYGITVGDVSMDLPKMMAQKDKAVKGLTTGVEGLFKKNKAPAPLLLLSSHATPTRPCMRSSSSLGRHLFYRAATVAAPPVLVS